MHECFPPLSNTEHEVERSCIKTFCLVPGSPAGNMAAYGNGRGACRTLRGLAGHNRPLAFKTSSTPVSLDTKDDDPLNPCFIASATASIYSTVWASAMELNGADLQELLHMLATTLHFGYFFVWIGHTFATRISLANLCCDSYELFSHYSGEGWPLSTRGFKAVRSSLARSLTMRKYRSRLHKCARGKHKLL